jgi:hypothetical protein
MLAKRKKVVVFFGVIILIYAVLLVYLMFFNQGLEIKQFQDIDGSIAFFLHNSSSHLIKDIKVYAVQGSQTSLIFELGELEPGKNAKIPVSESTQINELIATAPFHSTVSKTLSVSGTASLKLSTRVIAPSVMFKGKSSKVSLEICNEGSDLNAIVIEETHSQFSFEEENYLTEINLKNSECRLIDYPLTAKNAGETTIFFNIKALDTTKKIVQSLEVR